MISNNQFHIYHGFELHQRISKYFFLLLEPSCVCFYLKFFVVVYFEK